MEFLSVGVGDERDLNYNDSTPVLDQTESESTLDEPIKDTILRDVKAVLNKFKYVMSHRAVANAADELKDWDLWGPLLLCLSLSVILSLRRDKGFRLFIFPMMFVVITVGSIIVTVNAILLSGILSFFQSVCVLGYGILPLVIVTIADIFVPQKLGLVRLALILGATIWSTRVSSAFMSRVTTREKRGLALYPVWLFYIAIGWIIWIVGL